jgi:hypothetical protein
MARLVVVLLALVLAPVAGVVAASPASAATCTRDSGGSKYLDGDATSVTYSWDCTSSGIRVWGTLYDEACDNRAGYVQVKVQDYVTGGIYRNLWVRSAKAANNCGTWAQFNYSGSSTNDGKLEVCTWAANQWGESSWDCHTWYLW